MSYRLNTSSDRTNREPLRVALARLLPLLKDERGRIALAFAAILVSSAVTLVAPLIIAHTIDTVIVAHDYNGVLLWSGQLLCVYLVGLGSSYTQSRTMGGVGRRGRYCRGRGRGW